VLDEAHWGVSVIRSETSKRQNRYTFWRQ